MNYTKLRIASVCIVLLFSGAILQAKEWRGIVPLKSTRADVERLLGKPKKLGRYQFENERAYIHYSEGSCPPNRNDCQCLVPNGTVLDIYVNLEVELKFSDLQVDRSKYKKITSGHLPTFVAYSNDEEGIVYTIDEEDDEVMDITYLPTAKDCQEVIKNKGSIQVNSWRGIVPLKSTRSDVERLFGKPNKLGRYELQNERVRFHYAKRSCDKMDDCWCLAPEDTVLLISVEPEAYFKLSDLKLERGRYKKNKGTHLPTIVTYSNDEEGIIYTVDDEDDEVMDITYVPTAKDCESLISSKAANKGRSSRLRRKQRCRGASTYNYDNKTTISRATTAELYCYWKSTGRSLEASLH